jgi:hypothetical protein
MKRPSFDAPLSLHLHFHLQTHLLTPFLDDLLDADAISLDPSSHLETVAISSNSIEKLEKEAGQRRSLPKPPAECQLSKLGQRPPHSPHHELPL